MSRDVSRSLEPHLLVQGNAVISLPLRLSAPIFIERHIARIVVVAERGAVPGVPVRFEIPRVVTTVGSRNHMAPANRSLSLAYSCTVTLLKVGTGAHQDFGTFAEKSNRTTAFAAFGSLQTKFSVMLVVNHPLRRKRDVRTLHRHVDPRPTPLNTHSSQTPRPLSRFA